MNGQTSNGILYPEVMPTAVMGTNDSCTVSKRSVEMLYYPKPHFYRYFVKKPKKRAALINRGYLLRMKAIEHELKLFLSKTSGRKVIVNLGCGYDALPFRALSAFNDLCDDTVFLDIDYEPLLCEKTQIILQNKELFSLVGSIETSTESKTILMQSEKYLAVACDLSVPSVLQQFLAKEFTLDVSYFFIAEVSITYMPVEIADTLVQWLSRLKNAKFCLLEQCLPAGPSHPFASTMLKHFNKLSSPLRVVQHYQTLKAQQERFEQYGWSNVQAHSLWDIWCAGQVFSSSERFALRSVEMYDEHEEFILFASHYFVLTAASSGIEPVLETTVKTPTAFQAPEKPLQRPFRLPERRDGVLYESEAEMFVHHGGDNGRTRLKGSTVYVPSHASDVAVMEEQLDITARKYHTITKLGSNHEYLLVGGRDSPDKVYRDCWLKKHTVWVRVEDLPLPLFRHSAATLRIRSESLVVVFGGKTSHDNVSDKWLLWQQGKGWQTLETTDNSITPRFSANLIFHKETNFGMLFGGMDSSEVVCTSRYTWSLHENKIQLKPLSISLQDEDEYELSRLGATLISDQGPLILVGGMPKNGFTGFTPKNGIVRVQLHTTSNGDALRVLGCDRIALSLDLEQPMLVGHATLIKDEALHIVGGGAICFSFGSFMNSTSWHIPLQSISNGKPLTGLWRIRKSQDTAQQAEKDHVAHKQVSEDHFFHIPNGVTSPRFIEVHRITRGVKESLAKRIAKAKPCVFDSVDLGNCTTKWTPDYLKQALANDRLFDVHHSKGNTMKFENKNFEIVKESFADFIDAVKAGEKKYLRSMSFSNKHSPADFYQDFETLAQDFKLPSNLRFAQERQHSSVFRISGPINMWLHYDTLSNILCQIRGRKRLLLFSPADVAHLKIPPGRSSSDLNAFDTEIWEKTSLRYTHPYEAILRPGDVLYIPPFWCHAALPLDDMSIAINTFFKTDDQNYAIGKDTYGNRDVAEYEYARNDISKAVARFSAMPKDTRRFYLERLADEILQNARNKD